MTRWRIGLIGALLAIALLSGCAGSAPGGDPLEKTNRWVYKFNDQADRYVLGPASDAYIKVIPRPVRTGVGNFFSNLGYLNVILNDYLQGKCRQGFADSGRFVTNTTVGILGIFDVATGWGMPVYKNDFGLTLGEWGAGPGAYLVLPILGPSSARDAPGLAVSYVTSPMYWLHPPWKVSLAATVIDAVDTRARLDADIRLRTKAALDPYVFTRDAYQQYRRGRLHQDAGGEAPVDQSLYDEEGGPTTRPTSQATTRPTTQPTSLPAGAATAAP